MALKSETMSLAVMTVLLMVDVRQGPSTGMPAKTEQADLLMAIYGAGEAPSRCSPSPPRETPSTR